MRVPTLTAQEVKSLVKGGLWRKTRDYSICYMQAEERKFAFSSPRQVPTKVLKNRIKRRLREVVRRNLDQIPPGLYLIVGSPRILELKFSDLESSLIKDLITISNFSQAS